MNAIMQIVGAMFLVAAATIALCIASALAYVTVNVMTIMIKDNIKKRKRAKRNKKGNK